MVSVKIMNFLTPARHCANVSEAKLQKIKTIKWEFSREKLDISATPATTKRITRLNYSGFSLKAEECRRHGYGL